MNNNETTLPIDDLKTEPLTVDQATDIPTSSPNANVSADKVGVDWRAVAIGGVTGIMMGAAGTLFTSAVLPEMAAEADSTAEAEAASGEEGAAASPLVSPNATVDVATGVTDDMSFGEAFAAARHELGAGGVFVWRGNVYNTFTAEEWGSMTSDDHAQFAHQVSGTTLPDQPHDSAEQAAPTEHVAHHVNAEPAGDTLDVSLVSVEQVPNEDGSVANIGMGYVDGHESLFVDVDGDGEIDGLVVDVDDNGVISENEVVDVHDAHVSFDDLPVADAAHGAQLTSMDPYDGMPDYTNDADVSSLA